MGNLSNLFISQSFISVLHTGNDTTLSAQYTDIQDGLGNSSGVSLNRNGDLSMSGSLTASLQQGYVWVGNVNGRTITVPTSSFAGGGSATWPVSGTPSGIVSGSSQIILQQTTGNLSGSRIDGLVLSSSYAISSSHSELADLATLATNATYAQSTIVTGKNLHSTTIAKGTPLYFTGSGTSGNLVGVYPADAGNPLRMPAGGVAGESLAVGAEGIVLLDGFISGVNTSTFASGDEVFVAVGGGYTNQAPTGSALIQHLGNVEKSAVNGSGVIQMMGEVRGLPNIQQGYAWVGNSNGVPQAVATSSFGGGTINTGSFVTTSSFNSYTASNDNTVNELISQTGSYAKTNASNTFNGSQIISGNLEVTDGGYIYANVVNANVIIQTPNIEAGSSNELVLIGDVMTQKGVAIINGLSVTGSLRVTQTLTASLQQGYVWVGDSAGKTTTVSTSSFGGGGTINTGSFITNIENNPLTPLTLIYDNATSSTNVTLDLPSGIVSGAAQVTELLPSGVVSGSSQLTSSYDLRYALSGSGGSTINTGSFATTGSNTFIGDQTITGSLLVSSSVSSSIIVPNSFGVDGFVVDGNLRVQNGSLNVNQAINAGGIYLQTIGRNSNDPINVDNGLNIRPNAPGLVATNVSISGSLIVSQSISVGEAVRLSQSNPLPSGETGSLAVSGSNLYFFDGTWRQVSLI